MEMQHPTFPIPRNEVGRPNSNTVNLEPPAWENRRCPNLSSLKSKLKNNKSTLKSMNYSKGDCSIAIFIELASF